MSTFIRPPLDFTVVREDWSRYDLSDNTILKVKIVLKMIKKRSAGLDIDLQPITVVLTNEQGTPDTRMYSPQELKAAIIQNEIRFVTVSQDWNEYVVDDGTRIRIQPMILRVSKTTKFDNHGIPTYMVDTQATVQVQPTRSELPSGNP